MLTTVRVQNFKCLLDTKIDLAPFTVLIGPNDSGKTSFLDALHLLGKTAEKPLPEIIDTICSKYDVDKHQFEKDLDDFVAQLKEAAIFE